jgi:nitrate/nitrite-specific signal transduction histidine kinase
MTPTAGFHVNGDLPAMRHRASAIGALLFVSNVDGGGTEVRLDCPQDAKARAERGWG